MEDLIDLLVLQVARTLDIPKDDAGFLLLCMAIFLFAWAVSWVFLPWTLYSKLNRLADKLSDISGKLTNMSDRLHEVRDEARNCTREFNRLNEKS